MNADMVHSEEPVFSMTARAAERAVAVRLRAVSKSYGAFAAVAGVELDIAPGEMVSLLGPSGCGKTTTLRMIAGLEEADTGEITIGGRRVNETPPWQRNIGMVFQNYALFPHKTVAENIAYGLVMRKVKRDEIARRVAAVMAQVHLSGLEHRRPAQLSGGQSQRVAIARAIITRPDVLLFDEPLAALDRKLREHMQVEIRQLQREVGITTIFVTHDQEEALTLSDRVVVMEAGRIVQVGRPAEVYERPVNRFVSDFIGITNAVRGSVIIGSAGCKSLRIGAGSIVPLPLRADPPVGQKLEMVLRPEKIVVNGATPADWVSIEGSVAHVVYMGAVTYYHVDIGADAPLVAMIPNEQTFGASGAIPIGAPIRLGWHKDSAIVFVPPAA